MGVMIIMCRQPQLLQAVFALSSSSGFAGLLHGGKQQRYQNGDDRDDNKQLNQRKATLDSVPAKSHGVSFDKLTTTARQE